MKPFERPHPLFTFSIAILSLATCQATSKDCVAQGNGKKAAPPHVVIIVVDDMGYGDPGCYNADSKIPTPNIDSLAADGMKFTDAHAPGPLCHVSRYGLLTGRFPFRANSFNFRKKPTIAADEMTIASLLKAKGYRTSMVGKWHLGFDQSNDYDQPFSGGPVDRGFDTFFGIQASTDIPPYFYIRDRKVVQAPTQPIEARSSEGWSPIQGEFSRAGTIAPNMKLKDVLPRFTNEAIEVINNHAASHADEKMMLYLAYPAPHTPWLPSDDFKGKSGAGMYGDFAMMADAEIGKVLSVLKESKLADDTMVIFTSDNGPVWYDADVEKFGHDSSGGLRGMKADAWEAGHRMPFIVRWPGTVKPGSVTHQTICFTDIYATLARITSTNRAITDGPDSFSFDRVLKGTQDEANPVRPSIVMKAGGKGMFTIRSGDWKLITGLGSGGFSQPKRVKRKEGDPAGQLYDLSQDRGETTNVYDKNPAVVKRLQKELESIRDKGYSLQVIAKYQ